MSFWYNSNYSFHYTIGFNCSFSNRPSNCWKRILGYSVVVVTRVVDIKNSIKKTFFTEYFTLIKLNKTITKSSDIYIKKRLSEKIFSTLFRFIKFEILPEIAITQRSTQIIKNNITESDFNNSDTKENNRREKLRQIRIEKQIQPIFIKKRYIIETNDLENEFLFIEIENDLKEKYEFIFAKIRSIPEFIVNAIVYFEK